MTPQESKVLGDFYISAFSDESKTTVRVLKAIPEAKREYRPEPRSKNALQLAAHIVIEDLWFLEAVTDGQFAPMENAERAEAAITSVAQAIDVYKEKLPQALEKAKALSGEQLAKVLSIPGELSAPAVAFLSMMVHHSIHHRGQLTTYLRPMGSKVPSIYGPSADDAGGS
jgi:uncharacterized damage-inducible protein DinB